ncbi:Nucleoside-diphosphate-sugar epimerase [Haladaptatus litoreus]|uniref:Nucleoside-diphosphate-sugar epimerase n=1 Tax=Haladaptatus litoreus TaxID=553468 RepID=A0A1N7FCX0_9EURY|nr:NAD(P)-dependent oxidoreductase [Haladaptatus litoreus]SIR98228.1 Nucleoside-diphosphate-sugar epimerase [Haladaptatus litoreus]
MTTLVTGGLGRSGRWIVTTLADADYDVVCVDFSHPGWEIQGRENVEFRRCDLTEFGKVTDIVAEIDPDHVVHWGAIPAMGRTAGVEVFENNVMATYNVLVSAGRAGADIVAASSESAYGTAFAEEPWLPDYFPIDETHELRPEDSYGTSKVVGENIADMVTRKNGVKIASIRPSWIQYPNEYRCLDTRDDLPAGVGNFWSYVDVRDIASLVQAGLEADFNGHEPFLGVAAENYMDRPLRELIAEYFGEVPETFDVDGDGSAFTTRKAQELLEWVPTHSWDTAATETVPDPQLTVD